MNDDLLDFSDLPDDQPPPEEDAFTEEIPFQEYQTSGEEYWRVDAWNELSADFGLKPSELSLWHDTFAGQGRMWLVLRRYYYIACLFGGKSADEVEDRRWTIKEMGKSMGISLKVVEGELESAKDFWHRKKTGLKLQESLASAREQTAQDAPGGHAENTATPLNLYTDIEDGEITAILQQINLNHIKDPSHRLDIADRALALQPFLEDKNQRTTALRVIGMEVTMHSYQSIIINITNQIQSMMNKADTQAAKKLSDLETRLRLTEKALQETTKKHADMLEYLGASDIDTNKKKKMFSGALSSMVELARAYYENPENALADGMNTLKEIEWELTPQGPRLAQYRLDIAFSTYIAMLEENFYNPDYNGKAINRPLTRKLLKAVKHLNAGEETSDGTIAGLDDISLDGDGDADAAPATPPAAPDTPGTDTLTTAAAPVAPVAPAPNARQDTCVVAG